MQFQPATYDDIAAAYGDAIAACGSYGSARGAVRLRSPVLLRTPYYADNATYGTEGDIGAISAETVEAAGGLISGLFSYASARSQVKTAAEQAEAARSQQKTTRRQAALAQKQLDAEARLAAIEAEKQGTTVKYGVGGLVVLGLIGGGIYLVYKQPWKK